MTKANIERVAREIHLISVKAVEACGLEVVNQTWKQTPKHTKQEARAIARWHLAQLAKVKNDCGFKKIATPPHGYYTPLAGAVIPKGALTLSTQNKWVACNPDWVGHPEVEFCFEHLWAFPSNPKRAKVKKGRK